MKKYDVKSCKVIKAEEIKRGIFDFTLFYPEFARNAKPGQFVHIQVPGHTLRRPISICSANPKDGTFRIIFQVKGEGTETLSEMFPGQFLSILAPLGNGFTIDKAYGKVLVIGGGIGVPPLLYAAQCSEGSVSAILGFRNRDLVILEKDFRDTGADVKIATDDGSYGYHGLVTDLMNKENPDIIYACGPKQMLKAVAAQAQKRNILCEISLEQRMACGIGACLGCSCRLRDDAGNEYMGQVCSLGPVFDSRKVVLEAL